MSKFVMVPLAMTESEAADRLSFIAEILGPERGRAVAGLLARCTGARAWWSSEYVVDEHVTMAMGDMSARLVVYRADGMAWVNPEDVTSIKEELLGPDSEAVVVLPGTGGPGAAVILLEQLIL